MTDEELEKLNQDISVELKRLKDNPESPSDKDDDKRRRVLEARRRALDKIKVARESGNIDRETKACMEYAIVTEYAERNSFWLILARMKLASWFRFY